MPQKVSVSIVDDHPVVRKSLHYIVGAFDGVNVLWDAEDATVAACKLGIAEPDVLFLDLHMPGKNGLELAADVFKCCPQVKIILLSNYIDLASLQLALQLGCAGIILKECEIEEIEKCLRTVCSGDQYITDRGDLYLHATTYDDSLVPQESVLSKLTATELQILKYIAQKKTTPEIARVLYKSPKTIENHRYNICKKLNIGLTNGLLMFAIENKTLLA